MQHHTSQDARISALPSRKKAIAIICSTIKKYGGLTRDEIDIHTDLCAGTIAARISDCLRGNILKYSNDTRKTRSGRSAKIIIVNPPNQWDMNKALSLKRKKKEVSVDQTKEILIKIRSLDQININNVQQILNEVIYT